MLWLSFFFFPSPARHFVSPVAHESGFVNRDSPDSWRQSVLDLLMKHSTEGTDLFYTPLREDRQTEGHSASAGRCTLGTVR